MNEAMWGIFFVILGLVGIFFIAIFQDITTTNDQNYYILKETTEAAMFDSVDLGYFRKHGVIKINDEKFIENFTRRFSESINMAKDYTVIFDNIVEMPPKVTVKIGNSTKLMFTDNEFDMSNQLSAILETKIDVGENTTEPEACKIIFIPGHWEEEVHYKSACIKYKCDRFGYLTSGTSLGSGKRNSRDCCYGTVSGGTCDGDAYTIQWKCQAHPPYVIAFCRDGDRQVGAYRKEVGCSMGSNAGEWGCVKESCAAVGYIGVITKIYVDPHYLKIGCN